MYTLKEKSEHKKNISEIINNIKVKVNSAFHFFDVKDSQYGTLRIFANRDVFNGQIIDAVSEVMKNYPQYHYSVIIIDQRPCIRIF